MLRIDVRKFNNLAKGCNAMTPTLGDPTRVRVADARDEDELFELCQLLHSENGLFPMAKHKVQEMLRNALEGRFELRRGMVGVIGGRGKIEGSIYLEVGHPWYSDALTLLELWNYVRPEFRNSSNSNDLIAFAKAMANYFRVPLLIGVLSNVRTEAKVRLYRKQLGEPAGAFFVHQGAEKVH